MIEIDSVLAFELGVVAGMIGIILYAELIRRLEERKGKIDELG